MPTAQHEGRGKGLHQVLVESQQGLRIELLTGLAEGRRTHPLGQRLAGEDLPKAIDFVLYGAFAQIQQQSDQMR